MKKTTTSTASEKTLVGSLIFDVAKTWAEIADLNLAVSDFGDPKARQIFGAIMGLQSAGKPVDNATILAATGLTGLEIQTFVDAAMPSHCRYHATAIRDAAAQRRALQMIGEADGAEGLLLACEKITESLRGVAPVNHGFTVRTWGELLDIETPAKRFILGNLFACGQAQTIFGQGGLGKSRLGLNLARNQVLGIPFLDMTTGVEPMRHLFVGSENDIHRGQIDTRCMTRGLTASDRDKLAAHIRMTTLEQAEDCFINLGDDRSVQKWRDTLRSWPPDVLWVDPWGDVIEGDGFDRDVRSTISTLRKLAGAVNPDCGIVILAHSRTGAANIAQATGFDAANFGKDSKALFSSCRAVVNLAPFDATETPDLVFAPAKNNNGRRPESLRIRLDPESLTYSAVEPLDVEAWQAEVKAAAKMSWRKSSVEFDSDAVLGLVASTPLTKTELHAAIRKWNVTERDTRAGLDGLLRTGKLVERKGGNRNTKLIGTPQCFQT